MPSKDMPPLTSGFWSMTVKSQLQTKAKYPPTNTNLVGRVVIVTGGNTGIGFECARQFLSYSVSHLIITSRSEEKGKTAASKLQARYPKATLEVWPLDMCSYDSIQKFVGRVESQLPRLDIAILNAGLVKQEFEIIPRTGHEEVVQVNYLSTILLSTLLIPLLKKKSPSAIPGRLSIVSSGTTLLTQFPNSQQSPLLKSFDDVKTSPPLGLMTYSTSKLMGYMFVYKLADYVSADDVIVNLVDPGMTRGSDFNRELPKIVRGLISPLLRAVARNISDGASTYLDATVIKGKESHMCFVMDWEIRP
jgi:NAD(P)-dependent dehydrogenase (short-subunit alcohol dehydrogenase family)